MKKKIIQHELVLLALAYIAAWVITAHLVMDEQQVLDVNASFITAANPLNIKWWLLLICFLTANVGMWGAYYVASRYELLPEEGEPAPENKSMPAQGLLDFVMGKLGIVCISLLTTAFVALFFFILIDHFFSANIQFPKR